MQNESLAEEKNQLLYIKVRFTAESQGVYGIFYLIILSKKRQLDHIDLIASHYQAFLEEIVPKATWPSCSWSTLEDIITLSRYNGDYADSTTTVLMNYLDKNLNPAEIELLSPSILKQDVQHLSEHFKRIFCDAIGKGNISFDIQFEKVSPEQIEAKEEAKKETYKAEQDILDIQETAFEDAKKQTITGSTMLDITFVLSPVSGIALSELKAGDQIMIRISTKGSKGQYFSKLLKAEKEGKEIPIPAKVQKVDKGPSGEHFVITKIHDGIYGKINETEKVKIKRYDPKKDKSSNNFNFERDDLQGSLNESAIAEKKNNTNIILILASALILLTALLITYYFYV